MDRKFVDKLRKETKFYLAKESSSEKTEASSYESVLEDIVNVTEDDVPDGSDDSETDSDSYWSPVDEDECNNLSEAMAPHQTDECTKKDSIRTAYLMKVDSISLGPMEGVKMVITDSGNVLKNIGPEAKNGHVNKGGGSKKNVQSVATSTDDQRVESFIKEMLKSEAKKKEEKGALIFDREAEDSDESTEVSTFQNYHEKIAEKLTEASKLNESNRKRMDKVDGARKYHSKRQTNFDMEKCLNGYDVVDRFDVKVSERESLSNSTDSRGIIERLHAFAAGVRRSMSTKGSNENGTGFQVGKARARAKSDSWQTRKETSKDFPTLDYQKTTNQGETDIENVRISPKLSRGSDFKKRKDFAIMNDSLETARRINKNNDIGSKISRTLTDNDGQGTSSKVVRSEVTEIPSQTINRPDPSGEEHNREAHRPKKSTKEDIDDYNEKSWELRYKSDDMRTEASQSNKHITHPKEDHDEGRAQPPTGINKVGTKEKQDESVPDRGRKSPVPVAHRAADKPVPGAIDGAIETSGFGGKKGKTWDKGTREISTLSESAEHGRDSKVSQDEGRARSPSGAKGVGEKGKQDQSVPDRGRKSPVPVAGHAADKPVPGAIDGAIEKPGFGGTKGKTWDKGTREISTLSESGEHGRDSKVSQDEGRGRSPSGAKGVGEKGKQDQSVPDRGRKSPVPVAGHAANKPVPGAIDGAIEKPGFGGTKGKTWDKGTREISTLSESGEHGRDSKVSQDEGRGRSPSGAKGVGEKGKQDQSVPDRGRKSPVPVAGHAANKPVPGAIDGAIETSGFGGTKGKTWDKGTREMSTLSESGEHGRDSKVSQDEGRGRSTSGAKGVGEKGKQDQSVPDRGRKSPVPVAGHAADKPVPGAIDGAIETSGIAGTKGKTWDKGTGGMRSVSESGEHGRDSKVGQDEGRAQSPSGAKGFGDKGIQDKSVPDRGRKSPVPVAGHAVDRPVPGAIGGATQKPAVSGTKDKIWDKGTGAMRGVNESGEHGRDSKVSQDECRDQSPSGAKGVGDKGKQDQSVPDRGRKSPVPVARRAVDRPVPGAIGGAIETSSVGGTKGQRSDSVTSGVKALNESGEHGRDSKVSQDEGRARSPSGAKGGGDKGRQDQSVPDRGRKSPVPVARRAVDRPVPGAIGGAIETSSVGGTKGQRSDSVTSGVKALNESGEHGRDSKVSQDEGRARSPSGAKGVGDKGRQDQSVPDRGRKSPVPVARRAVDRPVPGAIGGAIETSSVGGTKGQRSDSVTSGVKALNESGEHGRDSKVSQDEGRARSPSGAKGVGDKGRQDQSVPDRGRKSPVPVARRAVDRPVPGAIGGAIEASSVGGTKGKTWDKGTGAMRGVIESGEHGRDSKVSQDESRARSPSGGKGVGDKGMQDKSVPDRGRKSPVPVAGRAADKPVPGAIGGAIETSSVGGTKGKTWDKGTREMSTLSESGEHVRDSKVGQDEGRARSPSSAKGVGDKGRKDQSVPDRGRKSPVPVAGRAVDRPVPGAIGGATQKPAISGTNGQTSDTVTGGVKALSGSGGHGRDSKVDQDQGRARSPSGAKGVGDKGRQDQSVPDRGRKSPVPVARRAVDRPVPGVIGGAIETSSVGGTKGQRSDSVTSGVKALNESGEHGRDSKVSQDEGRARSPSGAKGVGDKGKKDKSVPDRGRKSPVPIAGRSVDRPVPGAIGGAIETSSVGGTKGRTSDSITSGVKAMSEAGEYGRDSKVCQDQGRARSPSSSKGVGDKGKQDQSVPDRGRKSPVPVARRAVDRPVPGVIGGTIETSSVGGTKGRTSDSITSGVKGMSEGGEHGRDSKVDQDEGRARSPSSAKGVSDKGKKDKSVPDRGRKSPVPVAGRAADRPVPGAIGGAIETSGVGSTEGKTLDKGTREMSTLSEGGEHARDSKVSQDESRARSPSGAKGVGDKGRQDQSVPDRGRKSPVPVARRAVDRPVPGVIGGTIETSSVGGTKGRTSDSITSGVKGMSEGGEHGRDSKVDQDEGRARSPSSAKGVSDKGKKDKSVPDRGRKSPVPVAGRAADRPVPGAIGGAIETSGVGSTEGKTLDKGTREMSTLSEGGEHARDSKVSQDESRARSPSGAKGVGDKGRQDQSVPDRGRKSPVPVARRAVDRPVLGGIGGTIETSSVGGSKGQTSDSVTSGVKAMSEGGEHGRDSKVGQDQGRARSPSSSKGVGDKGKQDQSVPDRGRKSPVPVARRAVDRPVPGAIGGAIETSGVGSTEGKTLDKGTREMSTLSESGEHARDSKVGQDEGRARSPSGAKGVGDKGRQDQSVPDRGRKSPVPVARRAVDRPVPGAISGAFEKSSVGGTRCQTSDSITSGVKAMSESGEHGRDSKVGQDQGRARSPSSSKGVGDKGKQDQSVPDRGRKSPVPDARRAVDRPVPGAIGGAIETSGVGSTEGKTLDKGTREMSTLSESGEHARDSKVGQDESRARSPYGAKGVGDKGRQDQSVPDRGRKSPVPVARRAVDRPVPGAISGAFEKSSVGGTRGQTSDSITSGVKAMSEGGEHGRDSKVSQDESRARSPSGAKGVGDKGRQDQSVPDRGRKSPVPVARRAVDRPVPGAISGAFEKSSVGGTRGQTSDSITSGVKALNESGEHGRDSKVSQDESRARSPSGAKGVGDKGRQDQSVPDRGRKSPVPVSRRAADRPVPGAISGAFEESSVGGTRGQTSDTVTGGVKALNESGEHGREPKLAHDAGRAPSPSSGERVSDNGMEDKIAPDRGEMLPLPCALYISEKPAPGAVDRAIEKLGIVDTKGKRSEMGAGGAKPLSDLGVHEKGQIVVQDEGRIPLPSGIRGVGTEGKQEKAPPQRVQKLPVPSTTDEQLPVDGTKGYDDYVDIGSASDLLANSDEEKYPTLVLDDLDVISLSDIEGSSPTVREGCNMTGTSEKPTQNEDPEVFDREGPTRPPRAKDKQKNEVGSTVPTIRGSSGSESYKDPTGQNQEGLKRDISSNDINALNVDNRSKSVSDDSIFKGLLPFFDEKRKTLTSSSSKTLLAEKEKLFLYTDAFPLQIPDFPQDKRSLVVNEIFTTERSFIRGLEILVQLFKKKGLQLGLLDDKEADTIFSNVDEILDFNKGLLDEIYERVSNWSDDQLIGDIFMKHASSFKMYSKYCQNYDASEAFVKQKCKKKKEFESFVQSCLNNPSCQIGLTLPSYLITIVQRTPRYILLLKDLVKKTPHGHPDYHNLTKALKEMEDVAAYINNQLRLSQSKKALAALEQQIIGLKAYYLSGRTLVHEGSVCLMNIQRTHQCVLFNDLLVFASKLESRQSEVELVLDLSTVWFQDLIKLDPQTTKEDAISLHTPDRPYTIYVGTKAAKKLWLQHIRKAIVAHNFGNEAPLDTDISKRKATYTYKTGPVYSGDFLESKREGKGTMMWPNQMTYRGNWIDDERNGYGILEYGTGETYEGDWKNDKLDGYGTCTYSNGDEYRGSFKMGVRHGKAELTFANGDIFDGLFQSDRIAGEGKLNCKSGMVYEGSWKKNMKNGFGVLKMANGDVYEGDFKNERFSGNGVFTWETGAVYRGEFNDGQRHGHGTYSDPKGILYEGDWIDDLKHGTGSLTFLNGDVYEGNFTEGQRSGTGKITYHKGGHYDGDWENDVINGNGIMEYMDGSKYEGSWKNSQRHGKGKHQYANGSTYEGNWELDMPNGNGVLEKADGYKYKGDWLRGKRHGKGTLSDPINSYKFQGEWKNDKKVGEGIEMTYGVLYEGGFKNDKRDGHGVETSHDTTTFDGNWRIGQRHGKGAKKLINGMIQPQFWHMGCLMDCPVLVPRDVPPVERF